MDYYYYESTATAENNDDDGFRSETQCNDHGGEKFIDANDTINDGVQRCNEEGHLNDP